MCEEFVCVFICTSRVEILCECYVCHGLQKKKTNTHIFFASCKCMKFIKAQLGRNDFHNQAFETVPRRQTSRYVASEERTNINTEMVHLQVIEFEVAPT